MKQLLSLVLVLTFSIGFGQKVKPRWGKKSKAISSYYSPKIIGEDSTYLYAYDIVRNRIILECIEKKKMRSMYQREIKKIPSRDGKDYTLEGINYTNGQFLIFGSTYLRNGRKAVLKAFIYNGQDGRYNEVKEVFSKEVESKSMKGRFDVHISKDGGKVFVHHTAYYRKLEHTKESFKLLDDHLDEIIVKTEIIDGYHYGVASNFIVDDEGSVYFIRQNYLFVYQANLDFELWIQPIEFEDMDLGAFVTDASIALNVDNDLIIVGAYNTTDLREVGSMKLAPRDNRPGDTQVEGMFFQKIDGTSKETVISRVTDFDTKFIDQFRTKRDIKKGRMAEVNSISGFSKILFKDDGGVVLMKERMYVTRVQVNMGLGSFTVAERYNFSDIHCFNFSEEGDLLWAKKIPKKQRFWWGMLPPVALYGSFGVNIYVPLYQLNHYSYSAGLSNSKLYIIFNDHRKNKRRDPIEDGLKTMKRLSKAVPTVVAIDLKTGEQTKGSNFSFKSSGNKLKTDFFYQSAQSEPLYLFSSKKRKYKYGKVDLNEDRFVKKDRKPRKRSKKK